MHDSVLHAPVKDPQKVIDIGCGTGIVSRDIAAKFPSAQVYGIDLSVMPEEHSVRPSNLEYIRGDVRQLVTADGDERLKPGSIDYAFQRLLVLGMTDWPGYIKSVADAVRSGGWVEIQEWTFQISENGKNVSEQWPWQQDLVRSAWEKKGLDLRCAESLEKWMNDAGLVDVKAVSYRAPLGEWDLEEHPESKTMIQYLAKWWATVNWVCIPSLIGPGNGERIEAYKAQMLKDLEVAQAEQKKSYEIIVCYGRKP